MVSDGGVDSDPSSIQIRVITEQAVAIDVVQKCQETVPHWIPMYSRAPICRIPWNKFNAVIANIEVGNYTDALAQLQNDILKKTYGCANAVAPDKNDWVTTCTAQGSVYPYILIAIDAVKALMQ